jgi:hypothetical protein
MLSESKLKKTRQKETPLNVRLPIEGEARDQGAKHRHHQVELAPRSVSQRALRQAAARLFQQRRHIKRVQR